MSTIDRSRLNLTVQHTAIRQTPPPAGRQFAAVVAQGGQAIVRAALSLAQHVPGVDLATAALRGAAMPNIEGGGGSDASGSPLTDVSPLTASPAGVQGSVVSGGANGSPPGGVAVEGPTATGPAGGGAAPDGDLVTRGQEMSMRMLRLQESMAEENRRYTALSNVMHARHEMAKNAINNIR